MNSLPCMSVNRLLCYIQYLNLLLICLELFVVPSHLNYFRKYIISCFKRSDYCTVYDIEMIIILYLMHYFLTC